MRRLLMPSVFALVLGFAAPAHAVTLRDLIDLSRAGLSDDLLIALVEAEKSEFRLDAVDVRQLKEHGLSDRLLVHLLQTPTLREEAARNAAVAYGPAPAPIQSREPEVVVIDRVETIAVPVYIPVAVVRPRPTKPERPVYWGYGGKRRPDSWKEKR